MFLSAQIGATAYARLGVETGVMSANPHELVLMLFDGAGAAVSAALHHMGRGDLEKKGSSISKAVMIIESGLRASLNREAGGPIAQRLDALYGYMSNRLVLGSMRNQPEPLEEVLGLLGELREAWASIDKISPPAELCSIP